MKKFRLVVLSIVMTLSTLSYTSAYAGPEKCDQYPDTIHCAYLTGLSGDPKDGRFIKTHSPQEKMSWTACLYDLVGIFSLSDEDAFTLSFKKEWEYYICTDGSGTQCEPVGTDIFTIIRKYKRYIADPSYFILDISNVKDKYPSCHSWL